MNTVIVRASRTYPVLIGSGLLAQAPHHLAALGDFSGLCLVSDSHVWPLYGAELQKALERAGYRVCTYVFPAGEASKNGGTYLELLDVMARNHLTRSDLVVALGGGVVGDLAGFAAATYLRGIAFVQIPTTLLAMVDSSVGGKTAIDLPSGKNLAGAFCQPSLVLCDLDALSTLPREIFLEGCAEVIKYAILYDPVLFSHLEEKGPAFDRQSVITRCIELKRNVVEQDEFDRGLRMKLNLGHTLGHAVEALSHYGIPHGRAVAIGTALVTRMAQAKGLCTQETQNRILSLFRQFSLPTDPEFTAAQLASVALSDKKRSGSSLTLILPREIGQCDLFPLPVEALETLIETGL